MTSAKMEMITEGLGRSRRLVSDMQKPPVAE
jgi:hypothetical protein